MPIAVVLFFLSILFASIAQTDFCISPVVGGEPKLSVEVDQPYRIATNPTTLPGFDGLVVQASNRHELYEFDGTSLSLIDSAFPHVWGFANSHGIYPTSAGGAYGFGSRPRTIFHLQANSTRWTPIEETSGYVDAMYDQGADTVYFRENRNGPTHEIRDGKVIGEADLPIWNDKGTQSVRTIPEISGTLALTGVTAYFPKANALWFRPFGGSWHKIALNLPPDHRLLNTLKHAEIEVSGDLIRIFPAHSAFAPIFFRIEPDTLVLAGSAPNGQWVYDPPTKTWIAWNGKWSHPISRRVFFLFDLPVEPTPPRAFVLGPDAVKAQVVADLNAPVEIAGTTAFYTRFIYSLGESYPAIIASQEGLVTLNGTHIERHSALTYDVIGKHPSGLRIGDLKRHAKNLTHATLPEIIDFNALHDT